MKTCTKCGVTKPPEDFYERPTQPCKECHRAAVRARYERKPVTRGPTITEKRCTRCDETKPISEFYARRGDPSAGYWTSHCKACSIITVRETRERNPERHRAGSRRWAANNPRKVKNTILKRMYGITIDEYEAMLVKQGGGCAICGQKEPGGNAGHLHVDHCHDTKKVRGLLCGSCNNGLGRFVHRIDLLLAAIKYLQE
jgi:hypothetical protein